MAGEGFNGQVAEALRRAWVAEDVPQCGYCQPGQIMTAAKLLQKNPHPTDGMIDIAMSEVLSYKYALKKSDGFAHT